MRKREYFLRDLIIKLDICSNVECEIYPYLHQFKNHIKNLREFNLYSESDKSQISNEIQRKQFENLMRDLDLESENVFSKIFALFSVKKNKEKADQLRHERKKEVMEIMAKGGMQAPGEFVEDMQDYLDSDAINDNRNLQLIKAKQKLKAGSEKRSENQKDNRSTIL